MSIPLATTTITVLGRRPQSDVDPDADGYDAPQPDPEPIATGVKASITMPVGRRASDVDEYNRYTLRCDLFEGGLSRYDSVVDESNGRAYIVVWVAESLPVAYGLEHIKAKLEIDKGINSGLEPGGSNDE